MQAANTRLDIANSRRVGRNLTLRAQLGILIEMEEWSEGQLALFNALGKVCERFGGTVAGDLAESISTSSGEAYIRELQAHREKSERVDDLQKENIGLKAELQHTIQELQLSRLSKNTHVNIDPGLAQKEVTPATDGEGDVSYSVLARKYQLVKSNLNDIKIARQTIEDRLRKSKDTAKQWMAHADGLAKKNAKLEAQLAAFGIQVEPGPAAAKGLAASRPALSSPLVPHPQSEKVTEGDPHARRPANLPSLSPWTSDTGEETPLTTPANVKAMLEIGLPSNAFKLHEEISTPGQGTAKSAQPTDLISRLEIWTPQTRQDDSRPASHHSSSTQDDVDENIRLAEDYMFTGVTDSIKEEPQDTPILVSCRPVIKRQRRTLNRTTPAVPKVKLEVLSSSPIGLAGLYNLNPQDSIDLDEIGAKIDTPKKRRQMLMQTSQPNKSRTLQQQKSGNGLAAAKTAILQPASPNRQIVLRTSEKERTKRRRLDESGAGVFSEDGEHNAAMILNNTKQITGRVPAAALELNKRLRGLLEEPSPQRQVLRRGPHTPEADHNKHAATPIPKHKSRATVTNGNSGRHTVYAGSRDISAEVDDPDHEPFRARPIRRLGLDHFKINPERNQGYDFAYSDVIRGREQRACLDGCTKAECCGDKFRKLAELERWQRLDPTYSQEERDKRLLKDHLGDNIGKLEGMTEGQKEELLIQARARELSNKVGKHRHAFERRRSPPGFWRADFPSTQEHEDDLAEARKAERELVEQRYGEAMRPGGKWMFRDE